MRLFYLADLGYYGGVRECAYLLSMKSTIHEIGESGKKVVLIGMGQGAYVAETALEANGVYIDIYADNSEKAVGRKLRGKEIHSVDKLLKKRELYYFISTVPNEKILQSRLQFMLHDIQDYGVFFTCGSNSFADENERLHRALLENINRICLDDEEPDVAVPYVPYAEGRNGASLGKLNYLLTSTQWPQHVYTWIYEYMSKKEDVRFLDIGPGLGLVTSTFLSLFPKTAADCLIMTEENYSVDKMKRFFSGRMSVRRGYIEFGENCLEKIYDMIVLTEVFEHFALYPVDTLLYIKQHIKEGGSLFFTTPNWGKLSTYRSWEEMPKKEEVSKERYRQLLRCGHVYQYSKSELEDIFDRCGLKVVRYAVSDSNNHNYWLQVE